MTILIADDDRDDTDMLCEAFQEIDPSITLYIAKEGKEALQMLNSELNRPDFIFLDINMPKMDGMECLKKIKGITQLKDVKIIMYSTTCNWDEINTYKELGADFLIKPTSYDRLVESLRQLLNLKQQV